MEIKMHKLKELVKKRVVFLDGAFGTELQKRGLGQGDIPELWNVTKPEIIKEVHQSYIDAGSDIINTNTFGANRIKLKELGLDARLIELNEAAVKNASDTAGGKAMIAGSIGPTGVFLEPFGPVSFMQMYQIYKEQVEVLVKSGVDIINFETMVDIGELRAAVLAAFDTCNLPVFANMTFDQSGRSLTGSDVETAFNILQGLGCEFVGTNCGMGPDIMAGMLSGVRDNIHARLVLQANAGLPVIKDGKTVFNMNEEEYIKHASKFMDYGVSVIGGCCGTTPDFIRMLVKVFKDKKPEEFSENGYIKLSSPSKTITAGFDKPFLKVAEKINPSASKKLKLEVQQGKLLFAKELAKRQEEKGAHVLDVNMGTSGIDEKEMIVKCVKELTSLVQIPLCIDSTRSEAIEEAVKIYPGRVLINSISGEQEKMDAILPVMKRYGCYAILLPINESGIPEKVEERKKIILKVVEEAKKYGIPKSRFIVDALIMTVSAAQPLVVKSLETAYMAKNELNMAVTGGLSNVSFGLPSRDLINSNFLSMMIASGLDSAILNVENDFINTAIDACNVITGRDKNSSAYIGNYKDAGKFNLVTGDVAAVKQSDDKNQGGPEQKNEVKDKLYNSILNGDSENVCAFVENCLAAKEEALDIVNKRMIPAIVEVGKRYDTKEYFLPQLLMSAEAMKKGFSVLEPLLKLGAKTSLGKIVLATVKGDVHDIGKNIVAIMLSNHGFEVVDLGKDIASDVILNEAIKQGASIIGLSALMTTTMEEMGRFMDLKNKNNVDIPVMVGGAVVTDDYAKKIGAHYSKDAVRAVEKAKELVGVVL
jgi:5-methyltetrahydrofolate--homocysteine methyltransferase